ncbi:MAG: class I SAM-dependent methyltransferase [Solirubrobacterales bacterium]
MIWLTASSPYEQAKFRRTLAQLPARVGSALDLGCSVGVLTALLAPRCERLLAVDFSPTALEHARRRLAGFGQAEVRRAELPRQTPEGPFDAIVCSELLYYWSPGLVSEGLRRMEAALAPGGTLVAVHWRHRDPRRELDGDRVHAILRAETRLSRCGWESSAEYLLDAWRREVGEGERGG